MLLYDQDILENDDIKLENIFIASMVNDLVKGMMHLHKTDLHFHGNLKSSNCVVTSRWVLQITDYGLHELRSAAEKESAGDHELNRSKLGNNDDDTSQSTPPQRCYFNAPFLPPYSCFFPHWLTAGNDVN